ncbi:hypothetical protein [Segniliparus rugosus]|uniref:Uncharacterized protein n=1 Tax=Segniliparus rugosus (strain ATCC BAA-974 / DSM 45345 / CCUG 50838 / CIP 108380 / JCM 13579 / CDC 945) TaxID=679197 RepID=E5XSV8_SEGRC|nr:hypothetical protein [Segniliparus rugosus]EFV12574.1 hypothetical protein HMPREF9336_02580 [Segniliparus rugosus ATCC BAA-974]
MAVPVIGAEDPGQPTEPIVWARPPARPKPIDPDSLDPDALAALLERAKPKLWRIWPIYGTVLLLMQITAILLGSDTRHGHRPSPVSAAGFALYVLASALYILFAARGLKATAHARPKLDRNQALAMCGTALSLAAALPWSVFLWGKDGAGDELIFVFWPICLSLALSFPPQRLGANARRILREGALPSLPNDLSNLVGYLRFRRGDWRFPARLAVLAQAVVVLVIACSLLGPYALGWARPKPHGGALFAAALLLVGLAALVALRLARRFAGAPRRWWDVALGSLWLALSFILLCAYIVVISKLSPRPNQFSLIRAADWLIFVQAMSLIVVQALPSAKTAGDDQ